MSFAVIFTLSWVEDLTNILAYLDAHQHPISGLPLNKHLSSQMLDLMSYIDAHCHEISSAEEIAKHFSMSISYMCRLFREQLSSTPYKYLTEKRLEYAKAMLCSGSSVIEAAIDSGFYGSSVFIERFKKNTV